MSASYRQLASISQRIVLVCYAALLFIFVYSTLLMPSCNRQPNLFLAIVHLVPMLCFLPGMLRHNVRSYVWLCFLSLGYFVVAVGNAFGCSTFVNILEPVLLVLMFSAGTLFVRWYSRARAESVDADNNADNAGTKNSSGES